MRKSRGRSNLSGLGSDIKAARNAMSLTRRDLAEMVGIDPRYLANIENIGSLPSGRFFMSWSASASSRWSDIFLHCPRRKTASCVSGFPISWRFARRNFFRSWKERSTEF